MSRGDVDGRAVVHLANEKVADDQLIFVVVTIQYRHRVSVFVCNMHIPHSPKVKFSARNPFAPEHVRSRVDVPARAKQKQ